MMNKISKYLVLVSTIMLSLGFINSLFSIFVGENKNYGGVFGNFLFFLILLNASIKWDTFSKSGKQLSTVLSLFSISIFLAFLFLAVYL